LIVSALCSASATIFIAFCSALPIVLSAVDFLIIYPTSNPINKVIAPTVITITVVLILMHLLKIDIMTYCAVNNYILYYIKLPIKDPLTQYKKPWFYVNFIFIVLSALFAHPHHIL